MDEMVTKPDSEQCAQACLDRAQPCTAFVFIDPDRCYLGELNSENTGITHSDDAKIYVKNGKCQKNRMSL